MGNRDIIWKKRAQKRFEEIATWYYTNVGEKAMRNFVKDTTEAVKTLRAMPTIGRKVESSNISELHTFCSHPLITIAYTFDDSALTIRALRVTRMKNKRSFN